MKTPEEERWVGGDSCQFSRREGASSTLRLWAVLLGIKYMMGDETTSPGSAGGGGVSHRGLQMYPRIEEGDEASGRWTADDAHSSTAPCSMAYGASTAPSIGVERVFNYSGLGSTMLGVGARRRWLQGAVLLVGIVYMLSTLLADLLIAFLNPRVRLGGRPTTR